MSRSNDEGGAGLEKKGGDDEDVPVGELLRRRRRVAPGTAGGKKPKTTIVYRSPTTHSYDMMHRFGTQEPAFEAAGRNLVVFSEELPHTKRQYVVTGWDELDRYYSNLQPERRVLHELIRNHQPCRVLYVDLDGNKLLNPGIRDYSLVFEELVEVVLRGLEDILGIDPDDVGVMYIDASNEKKYSAHVLFEVEGAYWRNREEVQHFMKRVMSGVDAGSSLLYIDDEVKHTNPREGGRPGGTRVIRRPCPDMSVYNLNHTLRMYASTKLGEWRPLMLLDEDSRKSRAVDMVNFRRSLITRFPEDYDFTTKRMLEVEDVDVGFAMPNPRPEAGLMGESTGPGPKRGRGGGFFSDELTSLQDTRITEDCKRLAVALFTGTEIDALYHVSSWRLNRRAMTLTMGTFDRYCSKKGEDHANNNSCHVVDLRGLHAHRRCYSPNCGNNRQELRLVTGQAEAIASRIVRRELEVARSERDRLHERAMAAHEERAGEGVEEEQARPPAKLLLPFEPDPSVVLDMGHVFSFLSLSPP